jgi:hypothetical protein
MDKDTTDSLAHHAERSAQMREESKDAARLHVQAEAQRALQRAVQREQSIDAQEKQVNDLIPPGTTRDQLLDRIRQMREEKVEIAHDYYISPEQQAQLDLEQKVGREMVAREEARQQQAAQARALTVAAADQQGEMVPVHHPNPGQQEQYPAIKATLGKPPSAPKQLK